MTGDHDDLTVLHLQTVAALTEHDLLAGSARRVLGEVFHQPGTRRSVFDQVLAELELPVPQGWSVHATLTFTYRAGYPSGELAVYCAGNLARALLAEHLPTQSAQLLTASAVQVDEDPQGRFHLHRVCVELTVQIRVAAVDRDGAVRAAAARLHAALPQIVAAGRSLTDVAWTAVTGPHRDTDHADGDPLPAGWAPCAAVAFSGDLQEATRQRDTAIADLRALRDRLHRRVVRALAGGEIGGDYQQNAETLDALLRGAGLPGLPRMHRVAVAVYVNVRVPVLAADHRDALVPVLLAGVEQQADGARIAAGSAWQLEPDVAGDGWREQSWRLEFEVWLRGHELAAAAARAGAQVLRRHLDGVFAEFPHWVVVHEANAVELFDPVPGVD